MKGINIANLILLCLIFLGFLGGIIPAFGTMVMFGVIPLAVASLILSIVAKKVLGLSIANLILALLTLIPLLGTITAIAGAVISVIAIVRIAQKG